MQYVAPDIGTICTGLADSMGAVLLAAGTRANALACSTSQVIIHQPLGGMQGRLPEWRSTTIW